MKITPGLVSGLEIFTIFVGVFWLSLSDTLKGKLIGFGFIFYSQILVYVLLKWGA